MSESLRLCPFCGGRAKIVEYLDGYIVQCRKCGCSLGAETFTVPTGRFEPFETEQQAAANWNGRTYYVRNGAKIPV